MAAVKVKPEKELKVSELKERLQKAKSAVLADNRGLTVAQATRLRRELREAGVEFRVAKNTLIRIAANEAGITGLDPYLNGPTTIAFGYDDPVAPAKKLSEFAAKNKQLELKAAVLEKAVFGPEGVKSLADLPSREVLVAQIIGAVQAPLAGVVGAINSILGQVVWAIDARIKQLEEQTTA